MGKRSAAWLSLGQATFCYQSPSAAARVHISGCDAPAGALPRPALWIRARKRYLIEEYLVSLQPLTRVGKSHSDLAYSTNVLLDGGPTVLLRRSCCVGRGARGRPRPTQQEPKTKGGLCKPPSAVLPGYAGLAALGRAGHAFSMGRAHLLGAMVPDQGHQPGYRDGRAHGCGADEDAAPVVARALQDDPWRSPLARYGRQLAPEFLAKRRCGRHRRQGRAQPVGQQRQRCVVLRRGLASLGSEGGRDAESSRSPYRHVRSLSSRSALTRALLIATSSSSQ